MKKNKSFLGVIALLLIVTGLLAVFHLTTRTREVQGAVLVEYGGTSVTVALSDMELEHVTGTVVNNKGEERTIDGQGVPLAQVVEQAGAQLSGGQTLLVTAADEYAVRVTAEELAQPGKACLLLEEGTARLIVFGDAGAKRNVKNVVRLTVE